MATSTPTQQKPIHSLILDTGPLIKNTVSISTIINTAEELYTTPAILSEIRDEATRSRVQTTLMPFLKVRNPSPASYDAVIAFSKKTGDHAVLSRQDLGILALAYEVHCERNGGNWGLREAPKQPIKRRPGEEEAQEKAEKGKQEVKPDDAQATEPLASEEEGWEQPRGKRATKGRVAKPTKFNFQATEEPAAEDSQAQQENEQNTVGEAVQEQGGISVTPEQINEQEAQQQPTASEEISAGGQTDQEQTVTPITDSTQEEAQPITTETNSTEQESKITPPEQMATEHTTGPTEEFSEPTTAPSSLEQDIADLTITSQPQQFQQPTPPQTDSSDDDSDGDWITPSNLDSHQEKDSGIQSSTRTTASRQMDVATMTIDFAMQNVLLQMNLNLLSTNMQRIKHVNTKVLRCHACFNIVKQLDKQFCPRCGQATLSRVSCSTNAAGEFRIHLARNYQHNKRGDKYSVPKPIAGTANGKWSGQGGGQGGWGRDLILAEDQKEYQKQVTEGKRGKTRDLMDEDYLPGILTGDRGRAGGRPKVGAGKNVNAKKRA